MDYTKYDYDALVAQVTANLGQAEGWGEAYQSSTGQLLIQLFADTTDALMYMLEKRTQESFLSTARLQSSIFAHASEIGYRARRAVSSTGELNIILQDQNGNTIVAQDDIIIAKHTKVSMRNPAIDYVTTATVTIPAGQSTATIPIKEGTAFSVQYPTDSGSILTDGDIVIDDYRYIDEYSLTVDDSGTAYFDVSDSTSGYFTYGSLLYAEATDPVYDIRYATEGMRIVFGESPFGLKPTGTVTVNYVKSNQIPQSILTTGLAFDFETNTLSDVGVGLPANIYYYSLTNSTTITGYSEPESTIEIAVNAPEAARANERAVVNSDYEYFGRRSGIGGIVDVNAYGEDQIGTLIYTMNNIYVTYITADAVQLTTQQEIDFRAYMDRYKTSTVHLVVREADKVQAVLTLSHKKPTTTPIPNAEMYLLLKTAIEDFFKIKRGTIGGDLEHSDLVTYIQGLKSVVNGVTYNLTEYVKVEIQPQYSLPSTYPVFDTRLYLSNTYTPNPGDVGTVTIDGNDISIVVEPGDTLDLIIEKLQAAITTQAYVITQIETGDPNNRVLRLRSKYVDTTFTLTIPASDLSAFLSSDVIYKIPSSLLFNALDEDLVIPGSCSIVDSSGTVIFLDNGTGTLVSQIAGDDIGIDYTGVELISPYSPNINESYYFRYKQNNLQNIVTDENTVVTLSPFADAFSDPALFSTVTFV